LYLTASGSFKSQYAIGRKYKKRTIWPGDFQLARAV
jgi:hypothetical protein